MAVLWSCQRVVTCVTVFACFAYFTYLLTGTQKKGECWLKRGARPLPQVRGKGPGCDWTSGEAMSPVEVTLTLIPTLTLALTLTNEHLELRLRGKQRVQREHPRTRGHARRRLCSSRGC